MLKRLFWLVMGAGLGFGFSFWLARFFRSALARYSPERIGTDVADAVRGLGSDLRAAVSEGVDAYRARETELRQELERRSPTF